VLDELDPDALSDSMLVPSVRGDLLERAGDHAQAAGAFTEAAARTRNESERALLRRRAEENLAHEREAK
jgi:predicted RNA polymerase sigma factor